MDAQKSETPTPRDGELQPDFAIRFHESMMGSIPDTDERTRKCFGTWRDRMGDEPEVATAREYHKASEFTERRNVAVFEEHVIPERKTRDGKRTIPAVRYDRKALAAICKNMNHAIADVGKFCPITNGHTSDNIADPEPEVLAYSGTYRLGMIGNKKPRYAIFADEYHRKDREHILNGRRGRSVEVLPLPDVHQRSFYPIAALGADEPRLNLPPARYFNRPNEHGEPIEVERYMMVAPGGASTFIPSDDRDKYSDGCDGNEMTQKVIQDVMQAWTASAPVQWVIAKMEEEGKAGSPNPLVHQAPQMADMPEGDQGAPGQAPQVPGQPPQAPGMPGSEQPQDGDQSDPGMDMDDSDDAFGSQKPQQGAAGNSSKPPFQGNDKMTETKEQYSVKSAGLQALEARMDALETENAGLRAKLIGAERYSKLSGLQAIGIELDLSEELETVASQTDAQFEKHCDRIKTKYRRSPASVADFSEFHQAGKQASLPEGSTDNGVDTISKLDAEEVVKYALRHGISDYVAAKDRYMADKHTKA